MACEKQFLHAGVASIFGVFDSPSVKKGAPEVMDIIHRRLSWRGALHEDGTKRNYSGQSEIVW